MDIYAEVEDEIKFKTDLDEIVSMLVWDWVHFISQKAQKFDCTRGGLAVFLEELKFADMVNREAHPASDSLARELDARGFGLSSILTAQVFKALRCLPTMESSLMWTERGFGPVNLEMEVYFDMKICSNPWTIHPVFVRKAIQLLMQRFQNRHFLAQHPQRTFRSIKKNIIPHRIRNDFCASLEEEASSLDFIKCVKFVAERLAAEFSQTAETWVNQVPILPRQDFY
jgi:hypothetical protein